VPLFQEGSLSALVKEEIQEELANPGSPRKQLVKRRRVVSEIYCQMTSLPAWVI